VLWETSETELKTPGVKLVVKMLDGFRKMEENRNLFLDGKQSYIKYMAKDNELVRDISQYIDYYDVCEKSLKYDYDAKKNKFKKDHWAGKSQEEKSSFASLFKNLVEEIAYPLANEYFGDLKMKHDVVSQTKNDIEVRTLIKGKKTKKRNKEFVMSWYLHPKADGSWIIYDINIEGERWVPGFRSQFNDVIIKKNYAELFKLMKKKLQEESESRKKKDLKAAEDKKKEAELKDGTTNKN
ncbi:MAG: ABC transporter substrate-binding protein, partial [bacterium]